MIKNKLLYGLFAFLLLTLPIACSKANLNASESAFMSTGKVVSYQLTLSQHWVDVAGKQVKQYQINGQSPAPIISAAYGDELEITIHNQTDIDTIMHWHGLLVPNAQDGVADVTAPAIKAGDHFTYRFPVKQWGTYWYHAHGLEEAHGIYGGIILTQQEEVINNDELILFSGELDTDVHTLLNELNPHATMNHSQHQAGSTHNTQEHSGHSMHHGHHSVHYSDVTYAHHLVNGQRESYNLVNPTYRDGKILVRIVNSYIDGFINLVYSGGDFTVIASDGIDVKPLNVSHLRVAMGESYDLLLDPPTDNAQYELVALFLGEDNRFSRVLVGSGVLKPLSSYTYSEYPLTQPYSLLESIQPAFLNISNQEPQYNLNWRLRGNHDDYNWSISERMQAISEMELAIGSKIRINLHNMTMMPHPMHLHGHFFQVISNPNPLFKHTVNLDPMQRITFEFEVDEEGQWLFHCHNLFHMASGMMVTFTVV